MLKLVERFQLTNNPRADILSGLTVALALVPEAIGFSFVAGVEPLVGLYAAFFVGIITAIFGGRSGMISGATGAMAVVMVSLVAVHGVQYLFAAIILTGIIQIMCGVFHFGKFIRLVPHSVMLGFVNGLAIVIFLAQLKQFKTQKLSSDTIETAHGAADAGHGGALDVLFSGGWLTGPQMSLMVGLCILTMVLTWGFPKIPKIGKAIPSALAAVLIVTAIVIGFGFDTPTVGDMAGVQGGLPTFSIPAVPLNWETFMIILPYACILAAVGLIESLLTLTLIDEMTETRGRTSKECIGQGLANFTCGWFSAMGGCATVGQSMINIQSGGRGRLSGITAALTLLAFILFTSQWIEMIPLAALTGMMMMIVIATFAWASIRIMHKIPLQDAVVILVVTGITVMFDLAIAVFIGVIISALVYAWKSAQNIHIAVGVSDKGSKVYKIHGPLFFGSIAQFRDRVNPKYDNEDEVVIDFSASRVWDHSALEAIDTMATKYDDAGKTLRLVHLSPDCQLLLKNAKDMVQVNMLEDPHYRIVTDYSEEVEGAKA